MIKLDPHSESILQEYREHLPLFLETEKQIFHMPKALAIRFWECFAPAYFGEGIPLKEITEMILPFAGLKTLIVERDSKRPIPEFRAALKSIL